MKRVINLSKAWIAALVFVIALTGCGGGSSGDPDPVSQGSDPQSVDRSAALSWDAPAQRQNGESLLPYEVDYVISYGQDPDKLDQTVNVSSDRGDDFPITLKYTVKDLSDGKWYFSIQAQDNENGLMSPPSGVVSKTIQS